MPYWLLLQLGGASGAASIPFAPTATLAATDVQAAIDESDTENRALSAAALAASTAGDASIRSELASNAPTLGSALLGASAASRTCICAVSSCTCAAATFSSRYVIRFVPGIGTMSGPCANTQASASCAALHPYPEARTAEMAALTVSPLSQGQGDGERVLKRIEQRAKAAGLDSIFVLTTRTMHWFIKRGFAQVEPEWLPEARKRKYNWDRKSQVLVKKLA